MSQIKIFSPASVSNICCGFDVLGFSIDGIGDELRITKSTNKGVNIKEIKGYNVPFQNNKNTASVAAQALLDHLKINEGFDIEINKKIKPGSGIGSSAASAVGAVYGINKLLGNPLKHEELLKFAMKGEFVSSKTAPADNVASALYGGTILVNNRENYNVIKLPVPKSLYAIIHHPLIEIKTSDSRGVLPKSIDLKIASDQLSALGGFIHSLHTQDFDLMKISLKDYLVEQFRSDYVPAFNEVKTIADLNNTICCSISGSGPSIFTLVNSLNDAKRLKLVFDEIYKDKKLEFNSYMTSLNSKGVHEI
ncbi:MAG: homoserine kinase [Flavobacteriaceae bacterium]|nr:homoserine kinase [Flavobacteriaceae bacterium]